MYLFIYFIYNKVIIIYIILQNFWLILPLQNTIKTTLTYLPSLIPSDLKNLNENLLRWSLRLPSLRN